MITTNVKTVSFKEPTNGRDVVVFVDQVVAVSTLPNFKSTVIIGPGSTAIPVVGTVEEVVQKIVTQAMAPASNPKE